MVQNPPNESYLEWSNLCYRSANGTFYKNNNNYISPTSSSTYIAPETLRHVPIATSYKLQKFLQLRLSCSHVHHKPWCFSKKKTCTFTILFVLVGRYMLINLQDTGSKFLIFKSLYYNISIIINYGRLKFFTTQLLNSIIV